jgi:D-alanyl-D-alanine carboxypeptidase
MHAPRRLAADLTLALLGVSSALVGCSPSDQAPDAPPTPATRLIVLNPAPMSADDAAALDGMVEDLYNDDLRESFPGLWVGVWDPERGAYQNAWGEAVVDSTKASIDHVWRIGSITKSLTAVVVLQLVDEGSLALADSVEQAAPKVATAHPETSGLTIRQLLSMASGLPDYMNTADGVVAGVTEDPRRTWTADELIDAGVSRGVGKPGARGYSTTNYLVLQQVAEETSGRSLHDLIAERITTPLGMSRSALPPDEDTTLPEPAAHGYLNKLCAAEIEDDGGTASRGQDTTQWSASYGQGGGGMHSTLAELGIWGGSVLGNALISGDLAKERLRTRALPEGIRYGLGIMDFGDGFVGHSGEAIGWQAQVVHNPATGMTIAMATNACSGADPGLFDGIRTLVPFTLRPPGAVDPPS